MKTEVFYVITEVGVERWDLKKRPINIEPTVVEAMAENITRRNPAIACLGGDYGNAGVVMLGAYETWSVRVLTLSLSTPFDLVDGIHVPAFCDKTKPIMPMKWKVPSGIIMVLGIIVLSDPFFYAGDHYLIVFDPSKRMWRMPLSNLYEDCKLCHGQPIRKFNTSLECVKNACDMFSRSNWNQDLFQDDNMKRINASKDMFRFKPSSTGFDQLPIQLSAGKDWTSLCEKVAADKLNQLIQIV